MSQQNDREKEILHYWKVNAINKKAEWKKKKDFFANMFNSETIFNFLDGPPFANGLPHYGHFLQSALKDAVTRYKTMRGYRVPRRWGWDCHGLPVEVEVEKILELRSKSDIKELGIDTFNKHARENVLKYVNEWKEFIDKTGRYASMDHAYRTMDTEYIEGVWEIFKNIWDKNYVYQDLRPSHLCTRCETVLSNTEVSEGYKDIDDLAVYATFPLVEDKSVSFVAWTTTPWTLIGNAALCVNEDITYIKVLYKNHTYIVSKNALHIFDEEPYEVIGKVSGKELLGKEYVPIYNYISNAEKGNTNINKVYSADFVTDDSGTGIVHIAPPYGEDDFNLGRKYGLPVIHHVHMSGRIVDAVTEFAGQKVKPKGNNRMLDEKIADYLETKARLFKRDPITHSYPHCWRCGTPLIYYAQKSFFIDVSKYKSEMVAENKKVNWVPKEVGEKRFHNWIENAQPWAFARSRFWGAPIPVWVTKDKKFKAFGSIEEIKERMAPSRNNYYVMRHGAAVKSYKDSIWALSKDDDDLEQKGVEQVKKQINFLKGKKIDLIIYSPILRTKRTAEIVNEELKVEMKEDERIREVVFEFDKKREDGMIEKESQKSIAERTTRAIYDIDKTYKDKNILIVTHKRIAELLYGISKGFSFEKTYNYRRFLAAKENEFKEITPASVFKLDFKQLPINDENIIDFHRPYIDNLKLYDEGGNEMKRVEEVFDCWFESGCGPFASKRNFGTHKDIEIPHFINGETYYEKYLASSGENKVGVPVDFIGEGLDQTRGWFYSLTAIAVGAYKVNPFSNVICSGHILARDGSKMSKKIKNYSDPNELIEKYCADSIRYYLLSSPVVQAQGLAFDDNTVKDITRKIIDRLHNVLQFYLLYPTENASNNSKNEIDKWILSRLYQTEEQMRENFDQYKLDKATRPIGELVEDLSIWYVRRSRDRIKGEDKDSTDARATLKYVLDSISKMIAPSMPFYADYLYQRVSGKEESVHLDKWPTKSTYDTHLIERMKSIRSFVSVALDLREKAGIKVRQPLQSITIKEGKLNKSDSLLGLIKEEVNIKEIKFAEQNEDIVLDTEINDELRKEGVARDVIRMVQVKRKENKLQHTDFIKLKISANEETITAMKEQEQMAKESLNAIEIEYNNAEEINISIEIV